LALAGPTCIAHIKEGYDRALGHPSSFFFLDKNKVDDVLFTVTTNPSSTGRIATILNGWKVGF